MAGMTTRRRLVLLAACAVAVLLVAWAAGAQIVGTGQPGPPAGSVRLGPDAGEPVADYLGRLGADLPQPGPTVPALVQFRSGQTAEAALAATAGTAAVTVVWRVPVTRVQTALRFQDLEPQVPPATALDSARRRAADAAAADAARTTGRQQAVALLEEARLTDPACACVVAVVVLTDRTGLDALAGRDTVRAVQAAPPDTRPVELALAPLLPDQTDRADPPPDDGPVPPS